MRSGSAPYDHDRALIMPFIEPTGVDAQTYDVIVVGSGAAGGQTAYTLTMDGARVLMLEAGRKYDPALETPMLAAGGFYTTPQGRKDVRYVGNLPLPRLDGPPLEVLKKAGLA